MLFIDNRKITKQNSIIIVQHGGWGISTVCVYLLVNEKLEAHVAKYRAVLPWWQGHAGTGHTVLTVRK